VPTRGLAPLTVAPPHGLRARGWPRGSSEPARGLTPRARKARIVPVLSPRDRRGRPPGCVSLRVLLAAREDLVAGIGVLCA